MYSSSVINEQELIINSTEDVTGNYVGLTWTGILIIFKE